MAVADSIKTMGKRVPVRLTGKPNHIATGEVYVRAWSSSDRTKRAIKTFCVWLAVAVLSVAVPILHFFLVPLFFVLAVIMAGVTYAQTSVVLGGEGTCPFCGAKLDIVKKSNRWPLDEVCDRCKRHVSVEKNVVEQD
jgi:hypothetical protein